MQLFRKKHEDIGLLKHVGFDGHVVYDFRRRSHELFENYRPVDYKTPNEYDIGKIKSDIVRELDILFSKGAIDDGNRDCLYGKILGCVRSSLLYVLHQRPDHRDFNIRYGIRRKTDFQDLLRIEELLEARRKHISHDIEETKKLIEEQKG